MMIKYMTTTGHNVIGILYGYSGYIGGLLGFYFSIWIRTELSLPGKEVLGLRMFLFSTLVAQFVFTFKSKFTNGIGLQMVENVPFCLELARIVIDEGDNNGTTSASSTLFFLFALSSVIVGIVFYLLGVMEWGRIVCKYKRKLSLLFFCSS